MEQFLIPRLAHVGHKVVLSAVLNTLKKAGRHMTTVFHWIRKSSGGRLFFQLSLKTWNPTD